MLTFFWMIFILLFVPIVRTFFAWTAPSADFSPRKIITYLLIVLPFALSVAVIFGGWLR